MGEVSLWLTQKLNASMQEHEETSELRDGEDDHDIKNDDKLEGNSPSNRWFSRYVIAAMLVDENKRFLISSFCLSTSNCTLQHCYL